MSNFCIYCGVPLSSDDKFCPNCGKQVNKDKSVEQKKSVNKKIFTSGIIGLVCVILILIIGNEIKQQHTKKKYDSGTTGEYVFVADKFEQAIVKFEQIIEEEYFGSLETDIPEISTHNAILDADFEALKIKMGYDLSGPCDAWCSNAESIFYLTNLEDVNCYMNISSQSELIGEKNGEIVFYGIYGLSSSSVRVKDLLPNNDLTTEPAIYTIRANTAAKAGLDSYVWKLSNGYMAVIVFPMDNIKEFYDQYIYNVVFITDLTYLSYI